MDYHGKCMHPHGHNGKVSITLAKEKLDKRGMVIDFMDIKQTLQVWIDEALDHKMILRKDDPLVKILQKLKEPVFVMDDNPTAENIAKLIFKHAQKIGFPVIKIRFWETSSSSALYEELS
ncbi:MAG: 6-carboxytetrahydropterin synthase [Chlamydiae bacterium]|nr:6-carboxytetrahydropterin synthase [Chlamydiota bacterium]MBI3277019.1 6-carboxytetrahydropterin synthase [Chlamydiota bacterium]